jgi:hypothetical protein
MAAHDGGLWLLLLRPPTAGVVATIPSMAGKEKDKAAAMHGRAAPRSIIRITRCTGRRRCVAVMVRLDLDLVANDWGIRDRWRL